MINKENKPNFKICELLTKNYSIFWKFVNESTNMSKRKAPSDETNPNDGICEMLTELAEYEKNVLKNICEFNTYRKAASILSTHPMKITSGDEAKKLNGIDEKISQIIDEFLQAGKLLKLENIHSETTSAAINLLMRVSDIGPAKAHSLIEEGVKTIEDVRKHTDKLIPSVYRSFEDFEKKIPREEIQEIEKVIVEVLKKQDPDFEITICGSYRRGKSESGNIDTLITLPRITTNKVNKKYKTQVLTDIVKTLEKCGLIIETLSLGETKFMGACKLDADHPTRRLDIRVIPYDQYYCCVLYFTGPHIFNQDLRAHAQENGFTLNEYDLRPVSSTGIPGEPLEIHSEEDIFECIDFPYRKPEERDQM